MTLGVSRGAARDSEAPAKDTARVRVGSYDDLRRRRMLSAVAGGREVIVALHQDQVVAYEGVCLHQGGPLGKGRLVGPVLECPWHGCLWNLETGRTAAMPGACLKRVAALVENGDIYVVADADL